MIVFTGRGLGTNALVHTADDNQYCLAFDIATLFRDPWYTEGFSWGEIAGVNLKTPINVAHYLQRNKLDLLLNACDPTEAAQPRRCAQAPALAGAKLAGVNLKTPINVVHHPQRNELDLLQNVCFSRVETRWVNLKTSITIPPHN